MDKYIGFDIDSKKVSVWLIEQGKKDMYDTICPDIRSMKHFLLSQKKGDSRLHFAYEVSGYREIFRFGRAFCKSSTCSSEIFG